MKNYYSSQTIIDRILKYESSQQNGLNGFFLLLHFGTADERTDKLYNRLGEIIDKLHSRGYRFVSVEEMIKGK
jgi:peptidoglycan/xylan/chitin deacetylase (PgdA/CDA1 family)